MKVENGIGRICAPTGGRSGNRHARQRDVPIGLTVIATTLVLAGCAALAAAAVIGAGLYDVAANRQHWQITHSLLETTMHRSVRWRARGIAEPPLHEDERAQRGAACYAAHCQQCHGGPGVAPDAIGRSMQPLPGPLVDAARRWRPRELYWLTRNGIKMSGMPAWQYRLADADLWNLVAFVRRLPDVDAVAYAGWVQRAGGAATCREPSTPWPDDASRLPDARRGHIALHQYACNACHMIPGVTGSTTRVGPPLAGLGNRRTIAGTLPNTPENLARWLQQPQQIKPGTAMPDLQVTPGDARDMAAYLSTLRSPP